MGTKKLPLAVLGEILSPTSKSHDLHLSEDRSTFLSVVTLEGSNVRKVRTFHDDGYGYREQGTIGVADPESYRGASFATHCAMTTGGAYALVGSRISSGLVQVPSLILFCRDRGRWTKTFEAILPHEKPVESSMYSLGVMSGGTHVWMTVKFRGDNHLTKHTYIYTDEYGWHKSSVSKVLQEKKYV